MAMETHEFQAVVNALAADGWCVVPDLLTPAQTQALCDECVQLYTTQQFQPARIGLERTASQLRTDHTHWFVPDALTAPQQVFTRRIDALRTVLNRRLMLGLVDSEAHYAAYPPGGGYTRHRDCLHYSDARVVSAVFYLNPTWHDRDGGALRLYLPGSHHDIAPQGGRLVLFLSAQFEHEVLPPARTRFSIACWLRQRQLPDEATR
ncbi:MAG TPA: 2OG-Fe(II) oxygenase [Rhodanobacter sp.]|nr:2OG-Fe(II) oxygenase [Rhodanobacter sp.]